MSERERNRDFAARAFEAFRRGDAEAVNSGLDPEVEVVIADSLANPGTWRGIDGFWESVTSWLEAFDDYDIEVESIETPDDSHVVVEARQTAKGRSSGVPVELTTYFLFEVRGGRTARYELHSSRGDAMAAIARR
jgi:ketosteroid isomerase-like protein